MTMIKNALGSFRSNVITGALVLIPFAAVVWILLSLWAWIMGLSDLVPTALHPRAWLGLESELANKGIDFAVTLLVLAILIAVVWGAGVVSRHYLGKQLLEGFAKFLSRVPVLSTVYSTLQQLLETFGSAKAKNFRRVVAVEYPRKGLYTLAFVTGERNSGPGGESGKFLTIYVPTTPNPTSGFYLTVSADEVRESKVSVEEALKEIISMGIVHKHGT
ncbi:MAG TPA: DUF502 domain-containing protein [Oligoflexia bacterium]|nr:DUF502 domain-containing protein [Oligoflexia bacterium]